MRNTGRHPGARDHDTRLAHAAVLPSQGGITNARGLAGLYAALANGGAPLLSADGVARMGAVAAATGYDAVLCAPTRFALGFVKTIDNRGTGNFNASVILAETAFGHTGFGGSIGFADPAASLSFGYAMTKHGGGLGLNERGQGLIDAAYRAIGKTSDRGGSWI